MLARFELEQDILRLWGTDEDLNLLYNNIDGMSEDQIMNTLLGLIELVRMRGEKCFASFEKMLKEERELNGK